MKSVLMNSFQMQNGVATLFLFVVDCAIHWVVNYAEMTLLKFKNKMDSYTKNQDSAKENGKRPQRVLNL